jgi:hypothetical protein
VRIRYFTVERRRFGERRRRRAADVIAACSAGFESVGMGGVATEAKSYQRRLRTGG